jgi:hypothetical protein
MQSQRTIVLVRSITFAFLRCGYCTFVVIVRIDDSQATPFSEQVCSFFTYAVCRLTMSVNVKI